MPKKDLPDDRVNLLLVEYAEAVNWTAFGDFGPPGIGPQFVLTLPMTDSARERLEAEDKGRYELAAQQLHMKAGEGKIEVSSRVCPVIENDESDEEYVDEGKGDWVQVPPNVFADGEVDLDSVQTETSDAYGQLYVVYGHLMREFPNPKLEDGTLKYSSRNPSKPTSRRNPIPTNRGRTREWNWDGAFIELIRVASTRGLPEKQSEVEAMIQEWFLAKYDNCPAESAIRNFASRIMKRLKEPDSR